MSKKLKELQALIIPSDILPIGMILIGVIIAFFISEIAIKLIGISISILGIVTLLMKLTTRMSSAVQSKFKTTPTPNFKITVKKSPEAVRKVIENFDESKSVEKREKSPETKNTMGTEEGFRIVNKDQNNQDSEKAKVNNTPSREEKSEKEEVQIKSSRPKFRSSNIEIPTQSLFEELPLLKDHPDKEFEVFIKRILMAIRSVSNTKTACFFFFDEQTESLILNSFATESKHILPIKTKIKSSNDVVMQIAKDIKPEILTDINPAAEIDLLPYYKSNSGTNSFIGIPVIYDKNVIGVLTADSKHTDAYDGIMVSFMGHFAKLISGLIRSYSDKYDLAQQSKYYKKLNDFEFESELNSELDLFASIYKQLINTLPDSNSYVINKESNQYKVECSPNKGINSETIDIQSTLSEKCIISNEDYFGKNENLDTVLCNQINIGNKNFLYIVPLSTSNDNYGLVVIESKSYLDEELRNFIKLLCNICVSKLENIKLKSLLLNGLDSDPETGLLSGKKLKQELEKEKQRVDKFHFSSSLVSIAIDEYESIDFTNSNVMNSIVLFTTSHITNNLTELDSAGFIGNQIYVLLSGKDDKTSKLWAEQLRNKIASSQLDLNSRKINLTISVGITSLKPSINTETLIHNSNTALSASKENSNTVSVY